MRSICGCAKLEDCSGWMHCMWFSMYVTCSSPFSVAGPPLLFILLEHLHWCHASYRIAEALSVSLINYFCHRICTWGYYKQGWAVQQPRQLEYDFMRAQSTLEEGVPCLMLTPKAGREKEKQKKWHLKTRKIIPSGVPSIQGEYITVVSWIMPIKSNLLLYHWCHSM